MKNHPQWVSHWKAKAWVWFLYSKCFILKFNSPTCANTWLKWQRKQQITCWWGGASFAHLTLGKWDVRRVVEVNYGQICWACRFRNNLLCFPPLNVASGVGTCRTPTARLYLLFHLCFDQRLIETVSVKKRFWFQAGPAQISSPHVRAAMNLSLTW